MNYNNDEPNPYWEILFSAVIPAIVIVLVAALIMAAPTLDQIMGW